MSLQPLIEAPWVVQVHAFGAIAAFFLGCVQIAAPKGTLPHRAIGVIWVLLMTAATLSSIFIRPALSPGLPLTEWFSPIHVFTVITGVGLVGGVYHLMQGGPELKGHKGPFRGIFFGGLITAGLLAFLPGRIMHEVMFGG